MNRDRLESISFLALFAGVSLLLFFIFSPFIQILTLAAVFALLLQSPFEKLTRVLWGNRSLAALCILGLFSIFCIAPLFYLGFHIFLEAQRVYFGAPGGGMHFLATAQDWIIHTIQKVFPGFTFNAQSYVGNALAFISSNLAALVSETLYVFLDTFLMLLASFFFLRDGKKLHASLVYTSPFGEKETNELLTITHQMVRAVVQGTLFVAIIRWLLIGVAFYFFGIPNAILWGSVGGIVGAIPGLGSLLVFVPAVAYLYFQGATIAAAGLAASGLLVILLVDNILTPYFFGKGLTVPQVFILFSILGGIIFFGPIGFITGPLVLSVFLSMLNMYSSMRKSTKK